MMVVEAQKVIERIAQSGMQAHLRAAETAAYNISQIGVEDPVLARTRLVANRPDSTGGVRAETEVVAKDAGTSPVLDQRIAESYVRDHVDIVQQMTDLVVARRGFQANVATQRSSRAFIESTLNISA